MSRFRKLSHTIRHCRYHIVRVPKYRLRILEGEIGKEVFNCTCAFSEQQKCDIVELDVRKDHAHIIVMIPPKVSISDYMGIIKGGTAIRVFNKFRRLKKKPYRGNHFRARGCCVDTVGLDAEKIRRYVKYQEEKERRAERGQLRLF